MSTPSTVDRPGFRAPSALRLASRGTLMITVLRVVFLAALAIIALSSPGFLSAASLLSLVTTASFVGCVAVGMTLLTMSGNIMSFSLGATVSATTLVFTAALLSWGIVPAILLSLMFGALVSLAQGLIIGWLGANPLVVSIAFFGLLIGIAPWCTDGNSLFIPPGSGQELLRGKLFGLPIEFLLMVGVAVIGQLLLTFTVFGRNLMMVGSSRRAAEAAGIRVWRTTASAYLWAGLFAAVPGMLLAARYSKGNMDYGATFDYDAITAVIIGGTAIEGGRGSIVRTIIGVVIMEVIRVILLLNGFRQEWQYLISGITILAVILLQTTIARK
ncbi:ribose/xylose/arabinose/galactoside ABC-type transport system permease subunit [Rhodopseudomonas rhenobacensis]|uniref:Ribose/xylose/arabinose/galactoside ABC-type transport system permease subunit n=1 Tax=Rhodopseudomonas rhenobacensis TaxID=87461 RepID=A0A7W7Z6N2_9BRAD|nr:ABC transporter permease [Rhodopseudomonas rhenobacensis]MBB5048997.1 ribose/xylose/arabinose/galactoside ABC-type transport system permease subunit [Rhodopseudomonas rhenobacensis]